jgi:hypothetical protein
MSITRERADRIVSQAYKSESLRSAEENAQWVIRRSRLRREQSRNELDFVVHDACSCLHGVSYTMDCAKCKRTRGEAERNLAQLKLRLSIT